MSSKTSFSSDQGRFKALPGDLVCFPAAEVSFTELSQFIHLFFCFLFVGGGGLLFVLLFIVGLIIYLLMQ